VSTTWLVVILVGAATIAIKSLGPLVMGGKPLPPRVDRVVALLAPALLSALVAINTFADGRSLTVDARLLGVAAAGIAIWRKAPILVVLVVAAVVTATARAVTS
jgi:branched-subunit amino acid transport protein